MPEGWKEKLTKGEITYLHKASKVTSSEHPACVPPDVLASKINQMQHAAMELLRAQKAQQHTSGPIEDEQGKGACHMNTTSL